MNELIQQLVSQLGVQEGQAKGGAGLLMKLAQDKLGADFGKITSALPGVQDLISAAPAEGGAAKLFGNLAGALGGDKAGGWASLAAGFSQLKLDPAMIGKFVPIILAFVQSKAGAEIATMLSRALQK